MLLFITWYHFDDVRESERSASSKQSSAIFASFDDILDREENIVRV